MCKITSFKAKKGKNKYNTIGQWIKGSQHSKSLFIAIKAKTLTWYGRKVNFLIQPLDQVEFWMSRRAYFSLLKKQFMG